jgi:hypothetical protein
MTVPNCRHDSKFVMRQLIVPNGFCFKVRFGTRRDETQALAWLAKSEIRDLEDQIKATGTALDIFREDKLNPLAKDGYFNKVDLDSMYGTTKHPKDVVLVYEKEVEDMQAGLGGGHHAVNILKSALAGILYDEGDFKRLVEMWDIIIAGLEYNPQHGLDDGFMFSCLTGLALVLWCRSKYEKAEKVFPWLLVGAGAEAMIGEVSDV